MSLELPLGAQALVLSGGGGYGAYEIGVMRALFAGDAPSMGFRPMEPSVVTGTSIGAFNAAMLCSAPPDTTALAALDYLEDVWLHGMADDACGNGLVRFRANPFALLDQRCVPAGRAMKELSSDARHLVGEAVARAGAVTTGEGPLRQRLIDAFDASVLISADRFVKVVREAVDLENIRQSARRLRIAATNWRTGELRVFANRDMTDDRGLSIVLASTAIPGVFATVDIDGDPYADGGLVMNTPLSPAIDAGADAIHVIYMDPQAANVPLPAIRSTANTLYRLAVIALASMMNRDIEIAGRVNLGIDIVQGRARADESVEAMKSQHWIRARAPRANWTPPYRKLAIHRYHPHEDPGGTLRWLTLDRDQILRMMDEGYADAARHDCHEGACLTVNVSAP